MPSEKTERNQQIYKRRKAGEKYRVLAKDYGISQPRVRQIYEKRKRRERERKRKQNVT